MFPIIKIIIENNTITITGTPIDFEPVEMPYGCLGYGMNGSSKAKASELEKYWIFVDELLLQLNLDKSRYVTLKSIQTQDSFYGIQE